MGLVREISVPASSMTRRMWLETASILISLSTGGVEVSGVISLESFCFWNGTYIITAPASSRMAVGLQALHKVSLPSMAGLKSRKSKSW